MELYPRTPPTRERPVPRKGRKSWHRLRMTMAWVHYLQQASAGRGTGSTAGAKARLALEKSSRAAVDTYGVVNYFPEQVTLVVTMPRNGFHVSSLPMTQATSNSVLDSVQIISSVSSIFWACCSDYWDELVGLDRAGAAGEGEAVTNTKHGQSAVPTWADMLSMLEGYLRLYQGRKFIIPKVHEAIWRYEESHQNVRPSVCLKASSSDPLLA